MVVEPLSSTNLTAKVPDEPASQYKSKKQTNSNIKYHQSPKANHLRIVIEMVIKLVVRQHGHIIWTEKYKRIKE